MNIKYHQKIIYAFFVVMSQNLVAEDSLFEKNIDVQNKNSEINSLNIEKNMQKSLFYPEVNVVTGLGSEFSKGEPETEKGGMLYLDSKINLYNGQKDLINLNINEHKVSKARTEKTSEIRKIQITAHNIALELSSLSEEKKLLAQEKENNEKQRTWAKKKVDAGLTTNIELLDFQIKETDLENEIAINHLKIKENEAELLNLFGNTVSLEQILIQVNTLPPTNETNTKLTLNEKILMEELAISNLELQKSKKNYLPKIDIEAKVGNITPTSKLLSEKNEHQVALMLTIPLFNGLNTKYEIQQTVNDKLIKERNLRNFQSNINSLIDLESKKIKLTESLLKNQEESLLKAIKFYDQTINEYRRGIKNSADLISSSDRILELKRKIIELKKEIKILHNAFNLNYQTEE
jgi:outer membrane protein TolC